MLVNSGTVSVLILTYNCAQFIRESIDSALSQTYDNSQIVVSDDCSTDETPEILKKYAERHPGKILLNINKQNVGITRNANIALSLCTGEFVAFHAGDDVMLPDKLAEQVAYFRKNPECVLCYHNLEIFESSSNKTIGFYNNWKNPARTGTVRQLIRHGCFIGGNAAMVRRASLPPEGYNMAFPVASDWQLWIATTIDGGLIGYIPRTLTRYRRHENNVTSTSSVLNKQAIVDALNTTNWVVTRRPEYAFDALKGYAIHMRLVRRLNGEVGYFAALSASLKVWPTGAAAAALMLHVLTFGKFKP